MDSLQRVLRPLGSVCVLPRHVSKPSPFKQTHNPAQVFSDGFAKMYIALIKVDIFPTERKGCLLPSSSHVPFFLQVGGFPGSLR